MGCALCVDPGPSSFHHPVADPAREPINIRQPGRLGNFSQRGGDRFARARRIPLVALTIVVEAAEPADRTYVFIGVIPVFLLLVISLITLYLLAGQFASFVITSDITTHLQSMEASNRAIAHHLSTQISDTGKLDAAILDRARLRRPEWTERQVCAWYRNQIQPYCSGPKAASSVEFPPFLTGDFRDVVNDHGKLYLRTATVLSAEPESLRVILSEPFDDEFVDKVAGRTRPDRGLWNREPG